MPNRYVCSAIEELRKALGVYKDNYNTSISIGDKHMMLDVVTYRHVLALTEEIQTYVNRMESSLSDRKDLEYWYNRKKELKLEVKKLKEKKNKLEKKKGKKSKTKPYSDLKDKLHD